MAVPGIAPANQGRAIDGSTGLVAPAGRGRREVAEAAAGLPADAGENRSAAAERLAALAPGFRPILTGSRAAALEAAAGICAAFHRARGDRRRTAFVARERDRPGASPIARMRHTRAPGSRFTRGRPEVGAERAEDLRRRISGPGGDTVAACLVEPIAVAAGVLVPPEGYLERLRAICDAHRVLLVFDEASCGLGRTGAAFAHLSLGVAPDLIVLDDTLANGARSIGAILVRDEIDAIARPTGPDGRHGFAPPSPAACAAAEAALALLGRERLIDRAARLIPAFLDAMFSLSDLECITDIRGYGLLAALDFARVPGARGREVRSRLAEAGLLLDIVGDTAVVAPALTTAESEIEAMAAILRKVLSPPRRAQARGVPALGG
ncbi:MAG TPA: aminotransferase class III-fold pyridoxal phosphate-dependent enzyme [Beijerinckiaceae bacterium]